MMKAKRRVAIGVVLVAGAVIAYVATRTASSPPPQAPSETDDPWAAGSAGGSVGRSTAGSARPPRRTTISQSATEGDGKVTQTRSVEIVGTQQGVGPGGAPGSLAKIPERYELSTPKGHAYVNLAGGEINIRGAEPRVVSQPRTLHGVVVDRAGRPIGGAIVMVGDSLWVVFGHLAGDAGATTNAAGEFVIDNAAPGALFAIALHPTGWSSPTEITDAPLQLTLLGSGALKGRATIDRRGDSFTISVASIPRPIFRVDYETNLDGRFEIASLPPGKFTVRFGLAQSITGGSSNWGQREIEIVAGQTTQLDVDQTSSTVVVATVQVPGDVKVNMIEYWLRPGPSPKGLEAVRAAASDSGVRSMVYGGQDALTPIQFHDVAPGAYSVCAAINRDQWFGCAELTVIGGESVRELAIKVFAVAKQ
ncbi:MAG: carboxypeptidase-like regulatory domain-containing protein [Kofleriaceae bacterium]